MPAPDQRISPVRQACRAARVLVHVAQGLAITTFIFPRAAQARRRALNRRWSARLLSLLAIDVRLHGVMCVDGGNVVYAAAPFANLDGEPQPPAPSLRAKRSNPEIAK